MSAANPYSQRRVRAARARQSDRLIAALEARGLDVVVFNERGPHLRVAGVLDFWPSSRKSRPSRPGNETRAAEVETIVHGVLKSFSG